MLPPTKTLFHDKPYADAPVVMTDADEDTHFLPAVRACVRNAMQSALVC